MYCSHDTRPTRQAYTQSNQFAECQIAQNSAKTPRPMRFWLHLGFLSAGFIGAALSPLAAADGLQLESEPTVVAESADSSAAPALASDSEKAATKLSSAARHAGQFALRRWIELPPPEHLMVTEYENMLDNELKQVMVVTDYDLNLNKPVRWSEILVRHVDELPAGDRDRGMLAVWIESLVALDDTTYQLTWRQSGSDEFGHRISATVGRRPTKQDPETFEWYILEWQVGPWQPTDTAPAK